VAEMSFEEEYEHGNFNNDEEEKVRR